MDELEFAQQFRPSGPVTVNDIFRRQLAPDWEEIEADRREREAAAAREERAETIRLANHQFGDPLGHLTRSQMAAAEARDRVLALEDQLAEARKVLHRCAEEYVGWQEQAEMVTATASRSATGDLLGPARQAHAEYVAVSRAAIAAMEAGTPRRAPRPFVSRGSVTRSELECWHCVNDNVSHEDSVLLHLDPRFNVPITTKEQALVAEQAERRGQGSYAGEMSR